MLLLAGSKKVPDKKDIEDSKNIGMNLKARRLRNEIQKIRKISLDDKDLNETKLYLLNAVEEGTKVFVGRYEANYQSSWSNKISEIAGGDKQNGALSKIQPIRRLINFKRFWTQTWAIEKPSVA